MSFHDDSNTSQPVTNSDRSKLAQIELLARRHNSPAVNHEAHRLASLILAIIEGRERCSECGAGKAIDCGCVN